MAVYVDPLFSAISTNAQAQKHGSRWSHMICDGDLNELHEMAQKIGLKRQWFQKQAVPHYDLVPSKRALAIKHGAIEKESSELFDARKSWRLRWNGGNPDWSDQA